LGGALPSTRFSREKPGQNATGERFNWSFREKVLDTYLFDSPRVGA